MNVEEIMTKQLEQVDIMATIQEAARLMKEHNLGCLAVAQDGEIVGTITDRDIVIRILAADKDPQTSWVQEAMTSNPIFCRPEDTLETVAKRMEEEKIRRLIVQNEYGTAVGMVSVGDLAARGHCVELSGEVMEEVCCPA